VAFLILRTRFHSPAQATPSGPRTTAIEKPIPLRAATSDAREGHMAEPVGTPAPLQVSHKHVTDRVTEHAVRTLSRYELVGLRRRAEYGDDSAAFQMGMAYETGRGVLQRCTTAAQWVTRAAAEGNVAAQYNLGLRYRDGDGVPVNENEAAKWLQKAAARQNSDAQLALGTLRSHQSRLVASRP
jgi:TPR repeat protein